MSWACRGHIREYKMETMAACTLTPAEMPDRVARWRDLFSHALNSRLTPGEAVITFDNTDWVKSELDELVKLERICCAHVTWSLLETPARLSLTLLAVPGALRAIIAAILPNQGPVADHGV